MMNTLKYEIKDNQTEEFHEPLTQRELEVLELIAVGQSNQELAQSLSIAVTTVKTHVVHILSKLGVKNRTHAVARARALNLVR